MITAHAKTAQILECFGKISAVPRMSKHEEAITAWLLDWAKENGFEARKDDLLNVVIKVPASAGYEDSPILVLQGHSDMVCEKTNDSDHDFLKDPIKFVYEGEWLTADRTTLGADNGIALAMAMVAATDKDVEHPPLELLFTSDEETGLTGANGLLPDFIEGKVLLNIDSEDEGVFTVGCAGGRDTHTILPVESEAIQPGSEVWKLVVEGLRGGHSGVDVHEQRGNSIVALARLLQKVSTVVSLQLADFSGGTAHNAIPRDSSALCIVKSSEKDAFSKCVVEEAALIASELKKIDPGFNIRLEQSHAEMCWTEASSMKVVTLLNAMPNGVAAYDMDVAGLVETSNNLATVRVDKRGVSILTSQRSSVMGKLHALTAQIESVGKLAGAVVESDGGYPSWEPNMDSALLKRCQDVYKGLFDKEPVVEIIHAGLECGIIGSKYDGMDMIFFGPTIKSPHCPDEKIEIATIGQVWDFMEALFKSFKAG